MPEERPRGRRGAGGGERRGRRRGAGVEGKNGEPRATPAAPTQTTAVAERDGDDSNVVDLNSLYQMNNKDLVGAAKQLGVTAASSMR